ncbi:MAG: proline--tRNA ligase [Spirochaetes bacterium GWB1_48_6]|nr:MAG: proline--tRNA ligase [Spirochaetes bacterium GWB1_48_6]
MAEKITPRNEDYSKWYVDIVTQAKLADYSPVKGCMVIRPRGYALWENIQKVLDAMFKETGHSNAYFPMLIPESFLKKEAEHVEGFSPELAVVTHAGGEKLDEPLVIRPTSETMIWAMYKKWIQSYRDLPILINQWANVIRWEKRTRLFLRTTEFLWQEGHTAHATEPECEAETLQMLEVYRKFAEEYMAIPVVPGQKSESEKFAGAVKTYSIEAMMQDKKALQAGTSHNLGQNFAKAFDVTFQTKEGTQDHVWASSWGVSTRLVGALIMTHSDDKGLIIPPKLAPTEVVIIPILRKDTAPAVLEYVETLAKELKIAGLRVEKDFDDHASPGWKFAEWELLGVPVRIEAGPKDMEKNQAVLVRRDTGEKFFVTRPEIPAKIKEILEDMQKSLYNKALEHRLSHTFPVENYVDFMKLFQGDTCEGWADTHWCGSKECEAQIKNDTKATIRNIPLQWLNTEVQGCKCVKCGGPAKHRVLFAKSY